MEYNKYTRSNKYTPYKDMVDGIYKRYNNLYKSDSSMGEEIDWSERLVKLDEEQRPEYYGGKDNTYEVFQVLEAWGLDKDFYLGNVIKYLARAGKKNKSTEKEDLQKALVYLQKRIDSL